MVGRGPALQGEPAAWPLHSHQFSGLLALVPHICHFFVWPSQCFSFYFVIVRFKRAPKRKMRFNSTRIWFLRSAVLFADIADRRKLIRQLWKNRAWVLFFPKLDDVVLRILWMWEKRKRIFFKMKWWVKMSSASFFKMRSSRNYFGPGKYFRS